MTVCPACRHSNAEHLPYCSACGRRVRTTVAADVSPTLVAPAATTSLPTVADGLLAPGLAATIALPGTSAGERPRAGEPTEVSPGLLQQGLRAVGYVFTTIRGRLDAEERRRRLTAERDGALRLSEGTLTEVGQTILAQDITSPRLHELRETAQRLTKRREGLLADLAATEKFQAAEDLRLGLLEAAAETEWKSSEASVQDAESALKKNEAERREVKDALARQDAARSSGTPPAPAERAALEERRVQLEEQQRTLRERAAALSASRSAKQARLDQAATARRQAHAAVA
ncbi:MAG TPA: hypothetical protein VHU40_07935, partial [Polyangia bacterium]|nr:hypothetical protein [Polyangia bacterium]